MGYELIEPSLAQVSESSVMGPTLRVVEMRDNGCIDSDVAEQIEAGYPKRLASNFVDLVHRDCVASRSDRGGASEGDGAIVI